MRTERPEPGARIEDETTAQTEAPLATNEESYQLFIESVQEYAIFMLDHTGCIVTWNIGAERLFGYTEAEALTQPGVLIFTEEDRAAGAPADEIATARREGKAEDERWHRRKDGTRFWATGVLTRLDAPDGRVRGFAKILRDNTERKAAEEALQALNETLEAQIEQRTAQLRALASTLTLAEQEERRRISLILHDDLQQQLYGIQVRLTLLTAEARSHEAATLVKYAQEAYTWLGDAIQIARQLTVDLSPPLLKGEGLVDALYWLATQMAQMNGLHVNLQADQTFATIAEDMRVLLFQIIRELLFNVVKHAGVQQVTVTLREGGAGQIMINVTDGGRGFDVALAEASHDGSFGLFSIRERLKLFDGQIEIHSAPGQGTSITLFVPLASLT